MKKSKKLQLRTQTIAPLDDGALRGVIGGSVQPHHQGFIMQDTVIIRTGIVAGPSRVCGG